MFVFDIFRQEARRMQVLTGTVALGMLLLLGGLWWVQVVCGKQFETDLKKHSFRHVRTPALRGRILDRNGLVLADDKPRYNAILHLEDLQGQFADEFALLRSNYGRAHPESVNSKGRVNLPSSVRTNLQMESYCDVVSNITYRVSMSLQEPRALNTNAFLKHYRDHPYVPFQIVPDLTPRQVAILSEQWCGSPGIELQTQPVRDYPNKSLAANLLGYVRPRRGDSGGAKFSFDMPDYQGTSGVEYVYDDTLRGQPGDNSVLINNMSYRQREEIETPDLPGNDLYLTIDLPLQRAAEKALAAAPGQSNVRGAVVVMDPRNGDILALVSAPTFDPNMYALGNISREDQERLDDTKYTPQINRAIYGAYPPGSTFKIITALACLETGLDPDEIYHSEGIYRATEKARPIRDLAAAGPYDLKRALYRSSNTYFIVMGLPRIRKILEVAKRFHLGEKTGLAPRQESAGNVPGPEKVGLSLGMSIPDICIGQEITTTPLQMAGMISVIANGGTLFVPRVVSHARSESGEIVELVAPGRVRDHVQINPGDLKIIREAMLADTEYAPDNLGLGGTAYSQFHHGGQPYLGNFRVAGKTGTAEVKSPGSHFERVTWFDSYGPFEDPRYVVIVMVEDGQFGGPTCAPVAEKIYEAILKREHSGLGRTPTLAHN
jgi:penicillin-binding protein 2